MRLLFICNQNLNRSKTAELLFRDRFETGSAGLYNDTPVTAEQVEWADLVLVMEDFQRKELSKRFPSIYLKKRIISLDVPDLYRYNQPALEQLLEERFSQLAEPLLKLA